MNEYEEISVSLPKPPSLNQFYSGRHYAVRKKYKDKYWGEIEKAMDKLDKFTMDQMSIHVVYNCRFDVDNAICCCKFLADYCEIMVILKTTIRNSLLRSRQSMTRR